MAVHMIILKDRKDWLTHRKGRIGGSDCAAILGMNPYKTNVQLWEEKTGRSTPEDISGKPYVQYGHDAEPHLRALYALDHPDSRIFYTDNNMWLNDKFPWAHASLDGWLVDRNGRKGILEIKTTNIMQNMTKEKWNDRVPDNYYLQVLHYLMVTEFEFVELKAQLKYEYSDPESLFLNTRHYHIERADVEEDIKFLEKKENQFWENIKSDHRPALILPEI